MERQDWGDAMKTTGLADSGGWQRESSRPAHPQAPRLRWHSPAVHLAFASSAPLVIRRADTPPVTDPTPLPSTRQAASLHLRPTATIKVRNGHDRTQHLDYQSEFRLKYTKPNQRAKQAQAMRTPSRLGLGLRLGGRLGLGLGFGVSGAGQFRFPPGQRGLTLTGDAQFRRLATNHGVE